MRLSACIGFLIAGLLSWGEAKAQINLPIVHTWGDLQNTTKLIVVPSHPTDVDKTMPYPGPVTFQIGISSDTTAAQGAVVLYFLGSTGSEHPYAPEEWGLYWLQIDGNPQEANTNNRTFARGEEPNGTLFYAEAITLPTPGDHVLELIKPFAPDVKPETPHQVLARITIHVQDSTADLWYPLWTTKDMSSGAASGRNADGTWYAMESVFNPKGDPAIPTPPRPKWYTGFPAPPQPLPTLFPGDVTETHVQLRMADGTLFVAFDPRIEGFFPDDYFLSRWWVNGKLVQFDSKAQRPGQMRMLDYQKRSSVFQSVSFHPMPPWPSLLMGAMDWFTKEVRFDLNFKPEWIGAVQGDRIGAQFLYCPAGFSLIRQGFDGFTSEAEFPGTVFNRTSFSELSNRIEFTFSGDPQHPQQ